MKKLLIILCGLFLMCGCSNNEPVDKLDEILNKNNYILVDVRTKEEYDEEHFKGAINIPYDKIDENVNLDKNKTIVVYCRSGKRSTIAYEKLTELGYDSFNIGAYDSVSWEKEK